ncbi:MAG: DNRLRE domain-containing protein [Methanobacteriota archaeon]|nr:MAG: DNRLRE domain-containing protein [Euryarchaeota archaeon]
MSKGSSERGHVPPRKRVRSRAISAMLLCAAMLLTTLLALVPLAASDPIDLDNVDYTRTVRWDLDTPEDYDAVGTAISAGSASLEYVNESVSEDSPEDYAGGFTANVDTDSHPGSIVLDETHTFTITVEIQPDEGAGQDAYIYQEKATENYGLERELRIDSEITRVNRILMRFDLSSIPSGAYVDNATLWMYQDPGGKGSDVAIRIHSLDVPFVESEVTWNKPSISAFWASPGGDYSPVVYFAGLIDNTDEWKDFEISNLVERWIRGTIPNNGMIIVPDETPGDSVKNFISSDEQTWAMYRPRLMINYTLQGDEGAYESSVLGPGTNCTFTTADWMNGTLSLLSDEFSAAPLSDKWMWMNDPVPYGGGYNVGLSTPGWLNILGSSYSANEDTTLGANYLYQEVTGAFEATTSINELFTVNYMQAGLLIVDCGSSWVSISKKGVGVNGEIEVTLCDGGVSSVAATLAWPDDTNAHLRIVREPAGVSLYAGTNGQSWTEVHNFTGIETLRQKVKIGLFVSSDSAAQPRAEFDYLRVEPLEEPEFGVMLRTGNSTSLADPSWTDWSDPFQDRGTVVLSIAKYIRYRIYLATEYEWLTPIFSGFTAHWERYAPTGWIETSDYTPPDFSSWLSFNAVHDDSVGRIDYYVSTNNGGSWDYFTSEMTAPLYSLEPTVRLRAVLVSADTLRTPNVDAFWLTYGTALSTFHITVPESVTVGELFDVDIWAKNSENLTMTNYVGLVNLTAFDATGTTTATSDLGVTSVTILSAGHVTITNQRYYTAETVRILVEANGVESLSPPITVNAGPIASLRILPQDLDSVPEDSIIELQAAAIDEFGNLVPDAEYAWSITDELGELSLTTGASVTLISGDAHATGYVTVTSAGFVESRFLTIESVGHPPEFTSDIPDQVAAEDGPTWSYDIGPHVSDLENSDEELRWYVTGESLVTSVDENKTGHLELTLTPKPDCYGTDMLRLYVVDTEGGASSTWVTVNIEPVNDAPAIDSIPNLIVHYDYPYLYNMRYHVTDVDNNQSELSLSVDETSEKYVSVDNDRLSLLFEYPQELMGTSHTTVVTVSDGDLQSSTVVVVSVTEDHVPVNIESLPSIVLMQGEALMRVFDLDDYFMDLDGDELYYTASEAHVFVNLTDSNEVNVYAPPDWSGEEYLIISAIDPQGARVEDAALIKVLPVNQAPWIANVPDLQVRYDERFEFDTSRYIGDEDDAVDSLRVSTSDSHIAIIGTTMSMCYPMSMNGLTVDVVITVSDGEFSDSWTINVTISDNRPPESLGPPDHSFTEDWPIPYPSADGLEAWFEDEEDGDNLIIEAFCWCDEVNVSTNWNGLGDLILIFTTEQNYNGETKVTVRATDTEGAIVEDTIILTVTALPDAPRFDIQHDFTATVGVEVSYDLSAYITDPDSEPSQMFLMIDAEYAEHITVTSTLVRIHFPESFLGSKESSRAVEVDIRVFDQDGLSDLSTMAITVSKPEIVQSFGGWGMVLLLLTAGISLGLFGMVMSTRRKPFVIRDMMLVHEDGFLISRHEKAKHEEDIDEDIFTGMLTAVLNFVEDSMSSEQERLKFFGFEHYRVMIKRGTKVYAAVVFEGDRPKDIDAKLGIFLERVEKVYRKSLMNWTGDIDADFAGAHLMIETFVDQNTRKRRGLNGMNGIIGRKENGSDLAEMEDEELSADSQSEQTLTSSETR